MRSKTSGSIEDYERVLLTHTKAQYGYEYKTNKSWFWHGRPGVQSQYILVFKSSSMSAGFHMELEREMIKLNETVCRDFIACVR